MQRTKAAGVAEPEMGQGESGQREFAFRVQRRQRLSLSWRAADKTLPIHVCHSPSEGYVGPGSCKGLLDVRLGVRFRAQTNAVSYLQGPGKVLQAGEAGASD